ncbi:MAG: substrate-binding domain-containing protein, partial [Micrococcales bacterium]|nr:substrate-binding domain-containing protein [Micrococcales bacterium]
MKQIRESNAIRSRLVAKVVCCIVPLLLGLSIAGCTGDGPGGASASSHAGSATGGATKNHPNGSATATEKAVVVRPRISEEFVGRIDGSTATIPLVTAALEDLRGSADGMEFNTTPFAYENLIAGDKDVIFVTEPSEGELAAAKAAEIELEVIPIVKDALVFLNNIRNPVRGLSQQQVKDIYSGKTNTWKGVGGIQKLITAYQRPVDSGSQTLFLSLAMGDTKPVDAPTREVLYGMSNLIEAVAEYDNSETALGYSVFYYAQEMFSKDSIRLLEIDHVGPTRETIADESSPYITYYYAVIRSAEPVGSPVRQL